MRMSPRPNTPANSAPETRPTPPITRASTIGRPPSIENCAWLIVSYVLREERAGEAGHAGRQHEHRDLGLEHVDADGRRRGFAVAERDRGGDRTGCAGARPLPTPAIPNTAVTSNRNVRVPSKSMPNSERRPAGRLWVPSAKGWMKKIASTSDANASVASARYRPWSRRAGSASSAPTGSTTSAARITA